MTDDNSKSIKRESYLDVLRILSALAVIVIHVSANNWYGYIGSSNWIIFSIYEGFAKAAVPVFFMISGSLLLNKPYNFKNLFKKIIKLIIFLLIWSVIYKVILLPDDQKNLSGLITSIKEILYGNTQSHLWFIYAIIGLYLITPILYKFVHNSKSNEILYAIIVIFIVDNLYELFLQFNKLTFITNNIAKIKSGYSFGYIGYFLLGYYLRKINIEKVKRFIIYISGFLCAIITVFLVIRDCVTNQMLLERYWSYTMPLMVIYSSACYIFIKNVCSNLNLKYYNLIFKIADLSLGIYGIHFVFIILFWKMGFNTFLFNGIISVPIISIIVFICSLISTIVMQKIPLLGKFIS